MIRRILNIQIKHRFILFDSRGTGKSTLINEVYKENSLTAVDLLNRDLYKKLQANPEKLKVKWINTCCKKSDKAVFIDIV